MPAVGGVAERAEVGVVRGDDDDFAAGLGEPVELFHGADDIGGVLEEVDSPDLPKCVIAEGERDVIEIGNDVGARMWIAVDTKRAGVLV